MGEAEGEWEDEEAQDNVDDVTELEQAKGLYSFEPKKKVSFS